jgi:hypothetical protein
LEDLQQELQQELQQDLQEVEDLEELLLPLYMKDKKYM